MNKKIKAIEKYGERYKKKHLQRYINKKEKIYNNWYEAVKFAFTRIFNRRRRDELSEKFMRATLKTFEEYKLSKNYNPKLIENKLKSNGVNNKHDRKMVIEFVDLIFNSLSKYEKNIVKFAVEEIKEDKIANVFNTLDEIHAIGDKIASFYLRDVILMYQIEKFLKPEDYKYCQPIDTWVKQVALKIGL